MSKKRKILGISQTENYFNLDVRISIHKSQISQELIEDLIEAQNFLIEGNGNQVSWAKINEMEDGTDKLEIGNNLFFGVE